VSHISSRCRGWFKVRFNFAASMLLAFAAKGAANFHGRRKFPVRVGCGLASGLCTRAGKGRVSGPSREGSAVLGDTG
jgi:hypothetical protein